MSELSETDLEFANKANIEAARRFKAGRDRLAEVLAAVVRDIEEYEDINNLAPSRRGVECWNTVARAKKTLAEVMGCN